ncbi:SIR2 family protein [Onishia niordana]|uniref:SIR2 family protein n=1 Tax=Onishia niordana TaxID=2508711 RepID=UPI00109FA005|nr:SIR2 family protein [Halomonas niordiana]
MDYLRALFDSELTYEKGEAGEIIIAGIVFFPSYILKNYDPTAYEDAFAGWCGQKSEENISKADEILDLFSNRDRFKRLKEIYDRGAVTPFVGAGMSMPSGYPGWTDFLKEVYKDTELEKDLFDSLIEGGEFEEVAELLNDDLSPAGFSERVESSFGVLRDVEGCVRKLPYVFNSAVITTNFDNVLDRVYKKSPSGPFDEKLLASEGQELPKLLGEGEKVLVKLHGKANKLKSRVLTKSEYDDCYRDEGELEKVIEALSTRTLLFLGCSLTVDRTLDCLKNIVERKGQENSPRHYAFLPLENPENRVKRSKELAACNIHVIWYIDDHDECLDALLEKLADGSEA